MLANAKKKADVNPVYSVFDANGNVIYTGSSGSAGSSDSFTPYKVKVSISDLNIRTGPGTDYAKAGKYTGRACSPSLRNPQDKAATKAGASSNPEVDGFRLTSSTEFNMKDFKPQALHSIWIVPVAFIIIQIIDD